MQESSRTLDYRELLWKRFEVLKAKDPQFSIRRWAEQIDMNPGTLSAILNKKRHLPLKTFQKLKSKMNLTPEESEIILDSLFKEKIHNLSFKNKEQDTFPLKNETHYKVMAEWEHYAVLYLFDLKDFQWDTDWIAKKLGLSQSRTLEVIKNLLELNLVQQKSLKSAQRTHIHINTPNDIKSMAIQSGHRNRLEKAAESLALDVNQREFQAHSFAIKNKDMKLLKEMIRNFIQNIESETGSLEGDTLMQLNIQLFPLTPMEES